MNHRVNSVETHVNGLHYKRLTQSMFHDNDLTVKACIGTPSKFAGDSYQGAPEIFQQNIQRLLKMDAAQLTEHRVVCDNLLKDIERKLNVVIDTWLQQASEVYYTDLAKELLDAAAHDPSSTANYWLHSVDQFKEKTESEEISNRVFKARVVLTWGNGHTATFVNGNLEKFPFYVSFNVSANAPFGQKDILIYEKNKPFNEEAAARKYISELKKALEKKFFYDLNPKIPLEYRPYFLLRTCEVPGYRYESPPTEAVVN